MKNNIMRKSCKDVFHAFLVKNAEFDGFLEIPVINKGVYKPKRLIPFSKIKSSEDYDCWVHFYEDDVAFERIWNNPKKYLPILKKYAGVISPDFSLYRDMPLAMQFWNIYRSHAVASWLQENGINVIANVRYSDSRTYTASCLGVSKGGTISIGSHGCIKNKLDRKEFAEGLDYIVNLIDPLVMVVYGTVPDSLFGKYKKQGIEILSFESDYSMSRKERK